MASDNRRTPRIQPYVAPCRVIDGARRLAAYVTDLSLAGARVCCDAQPPGPGTPVVLEVRLGRRFPLSRLHGEVKWVRPSGKPEGGHVFGLTFAGITADEQRVVETVLEEFQRRAAELA